jgi:hypothetical protein
VVGATDDTLFECPFLFASDVGTVGLDEVERQSGRMGTPERGAESARPQLRAIFEELGRPLGIDVLVWTMSH